MQNIHKPIIPQLNYALIEKKYTSTLKSSIEQKPHQMTSKPSAMFKIDNQHQNNYHTNNFQHSDFSTATTEDYDPLAVTFIEPKNHVTKIIRPLPVNSEPKSLDLAPVNETFEIFDDEFSDFQCAQFTNTDNKNNNEFTDFQSAFDALTFKEIPKTVETDVELLDVSLNDVASTSFKDQNLISYQDVHDKYEVFRTLAAETIDAENLTNENDNDNDLLDVKPLEPIENDQNYDVHDDEFGDFLCVEEVPSNKPEIEVDWKNVQVCFFQTTFFLLYFFAK